MTPNCEDADCAAGMADLAVISAQWYQYNRADTYDFLYRMSRAQSLQVWGITPSTLALTECGTADTGILLTGATFLATGAATFAAIASILN